MNNRIRVAVVGVGALGQHHARVYSELDNVELVAVVDSRKDRAEEVAGRFCCQAYTDYQRLPASVEAISLAVPTSLHAEVGVPLLKNGIHLLVEKPIATTLTDADRLIEASTKHGNTLHIGHSERFNPAFSCVRPFIRKPRFFEAHRLGVFVPRSLDVDVVLDLMIHDLDLLLHLSSAGVAEIRAVGIPVLTPRIDIANARIEFEDGAVANVTASRVSRDKIRKLRLFQAHDYISIDFHSHAVEMYSLDLSSGSPKICERIPEVQRDEPLRREVEAFLEAVRGESPPLACSGVEGRQSLSVGLDIIAAMTQRS